MSVGDYIGAGIVAIGLICLAVLIGHGIWEDARFLRRLSRGDRRWQAFNAEDDEPRAQGWTKGDD